MGERLARRVRLCALVAAVFLAGCGGGGGDEAPAAAGPPTVGADGGTVSAEGVKLVIPPGAMTADTTIRIAKDSTGAPPLPQWAQAAGDMLAITPHGSEFSEPVTVRVPVPNAIVSSKYSSTRRTGRTALPCGRLHRRRGCMPCRPTGRCWRSSPTGST